MEGPTWRGFTVFLLAAFSPLARFTSRQPLLNPDSPTSIQDVSTLEEWLDMVRLGKYRRSFYAHGINDLEALSNISTK